MPNPKIIVQVLIEDDVRYEFPCKSLAEAQAVKFALNEAFRICSNDSYDVDIKQ